MRILYTIYPMYVYIYIYINAVRRKLEFKVRDHTRRSTRLRLVSVTLLNCKRHSGAQIHSHTTIIKIIQVNYYTSNKYIHTYIHIHLLTSTHKQIYNIEYDIAKKTLSHTTYTRIYILNLIQNNIPNRKR